MSHSFLDVHSPVQSGRARRGRGGEKEREEEGGEEERKEGAIRRV